MNTSQRASLPIPQEERTSLQQSLQSTSQRTAVLASELQAAAHQAERAGRLQESLEQCVVARELLEAEARAAGLEAREARARGRALQETVQDLEARCSDARARASEGARDLAQSERTQALTLQRVRSRGRGPGARTLFRKRRSSRSFEWRLG